MAEYKKRLLYMHIMKPGKLGLDLDVLNLFAKDEAQFFFRSWYFRQNSLFNKSNQTNDIF